MNNDIIELMNMDETEKDLPNNIFPMLTEQKMVEARERMRISDELYNTSLDDILRLIMRDENYIPVAPQKETWYTKLIINDTQLYYVFDNDIDYRRIIMIFYDMEIEENGIFGINWLHLLKMVEIHGGNYLDKYDGGAYYRYSYRMS